MVTIIRVLACLLVLHPSMLLAADCSNLKHLTIADAEITMAETVTSGELKVDGVAAPLRNLPAFCRVAGSFRPTTDSDIRFEVWLPEQGWNGRGISGWATEASRVRSGMRSSLLISSADSPSPDRIQAIRQRTPMRVGRLGT
jgi:hypothetical protein